MESQLEGGKTLRKWVFMNDFEIMHHLFFNWPLFDPIKTSLMVVIKGIILDCKDIIIAKKELFREIYLFYISPILHV